MTSLHKLIKIVNKSSKRVGRGEGSGKSKTSGRGTKGQNARHKISLTHSHFEGGQRQLTKRLPYRRGKGNSKVSVKPLVINVSDLKNVDAKTPITLVTLIEQGLVSEKEAKSRGIKILGMGKLEKSLDVKLPMSNKLKVKLGH